MVKVKTSELTGAALDWAVAKCEGALAPVGNVRIIDGKWLLICVGGDPDHGGSRVYFNPSTDWSQGGPIIEREGISWHCGNKTTWHAYAYGSGNNISGPTPLIAAMRCFVASQLGDEVEVPKELL